VVVYRLYAQNLGLTIDELDVSAEGDLDVRGLFGADETVRPGFSSVRVSVNIAGPDSNEDYQKLQETVDAHCPVFDIFTNPELTVPSIIMTLRTTDSNDVLVGICLMIGGRSAPARPTSIT
ncbi:OsmC-like protein, partial [Brevibacterium sp. Mu109]|uniref:OsmC family protein n=1 Tax=Brevibacterium sp. Mu109 TaxID=1255669 RepID=UPI000C51B4B9